MLVSDITKTFSFEAAHFLYGHSGACRNIHGHSYKGEVTLVNLGIDEDTGIAFDFSTLSEIIRKVVITYYDHSLLINERAFKDKITLENFLLILSTLGIDKQSVKVLPYNPTAENMAMDIAFRIKEVVRCIFGNDYTKVKVKLYETAKSYVQVFK